MAAAEAAEPGFRRVPIDAALALAARTSLHPWPVAVITLRTIGCSAEAGGATGAWRSILAVVVAMLAFNAAAPLGGNCMAGIDPA